MFDIIKRLFYYFFAVLINGSKTGENNMSEKVTLYILQDETGYSIVSSNGAEYGVVADDLKNAIGMAKEIISNGWADQFCIDE
jgi:hypothetical protein